GYDLAVLAKDVISRKAGILIGEDETGYIALHLSLALRRIDKTEKNKKIIVVCTTGQGTARMIKYKLMNRFRFAEGDITLIPYYRLSRMDLSEYNCILSTIPIDQKYSIPSFLVTFENDISFSQSFASYINRGEVTGDLDRNLVFTHQSFDSAEEVLRFMGKKIEEYYEMGNDFTESVLKREALASTEVGNLLAVPHAFEYSYPFNILAVLVLERKIKWKNHSVQVVVLSAYPLSEDNSVINDRIAELASDPGKIEKIISSQSYAVINNTLLGGNV
ncbi:MAG: PTS sugar transporter subunit IIA, partial [Erysipelotrichaceae bacterium]|nr:PTS sugar transporter subunit IIA [Erysipelotrichaceae bacterium]